jgi:hypothetical protein
MNGRDLGLLFGGFIIGVATGIMFKKKEEPTKEELVKELNEDCNFVVEDNHTAPPDYLENQAKWEAHVIKVMNKFRQKQLKNMEPYSEKNPPEPLTVEEMQLHTMLKNKLLEGKIRMSDVECNALAMLNEYMHIANNV